MEQRASEKAKYIWNKTWKKTSLFGAPQKVRPHAAASVLIFLQSPVHELPYNWFVVYADDSIQYYGIIG